MKWFCRSAEIAAAIVLMTAAHSQLSAQNVIPQQFSYQGIARSTSGEAIVNTPIKVRFSILAGSSLGNIVYVEEHETSTNEFGLFNLFVGRGVVQHGTFSEIAWAQNLKYLKIEIDVPDEDGYTPVGTTPLSSVPYALAAGKPADMKLSDLSDVSNTQPLAGQGLVWDGTTWTPGAGGGAGGSNLVLSPRLSGTGTSANPIDIARQDAQFNEVLKWDGTNWVPGEDEGENLTAGSGIEIINKQITHGPHYGDVAGSRDLTVTGLRGRPIISNPPTDGQILKYVEGQGWTPSPDNSITLIAGNGIEINGFTISSTLWQANGGNVFRTQGNVGIGTGSPQQQLVVAKNFQLGGAFMPGGTAGLSGQILTTAGPNLPPVWKYPNDVIKTVAWTTTGNSGTNAATNYIGTSDANPLLIKTSGNERIRITSDGNVGIGATTPGAKLTVGGDVYVNNSANGIILKSPNGSCFRVTVNNDGTLSTTSVSCP